MASNTVIVTSTDRGYLPAACCQLYSAHTNLQNKYDASLFLVCCDVDDADLTKARKMFAARQMEVQIVHAIDIAEKIKTIKGRRWPRAAYLRLYFDEIFGPEIERLVYLDADTRVLTDLTPLLKVDLYGNPVGAVHDLFYYVTNRIGERRQMLFLGSDAPYLQSGVMVFDWRATLELGLLTEARRFIEHYPDRCVEAPDQDALNAILKDRWMPLDPRWNLHESYLKYASAHTAFIEHYTSSKPWSRKRAPAWKDASEWYRQQLADTGWTEFVDQPSLLESLKLELDFLIYKSIVRLKYFLSDYTPSLLECFGISTCRKNSPQHNVPRSRKHVELMLDIEIEEATRQRSPLRLPESVLGFSSK